MAKGKGKRRGGANGRKGDSGWRDGLSIGTTALIVAMAVGGPLGGIVETVGIGTALLILAASIGVAIVFDIVAVAATAGEEAPFNAMATDKVPGAREALVIVRNASKVSSICSDIVGDICGTISGVAAAPVIVSVSRLYPQIPTSVVSMLVIGVIAFFTIGGKAAEKAYALRASTSVILFVGRIIYYLKRLRLFSRSSPARSR